MPPSLKRRVLLVFLDGVGIGPSERAVNPFFEARLPTLRQLLGSRLPHLEAREIGTESAQAFPLDPLLGVAGLPQSGTGQTALLTGENAPAAFGRHFGPWVPVGLRPMLREKNLLSRALAQGISCAFANAHPKQFLAATRERRPAGPPLAAHAAGLLTRHETHLAAGEALSSEIVNTGWRRRFGDSSIPEITPSEAGSNLARIAESARLTLFAHYATDLAGHTGVMSEAVHALERVDAFLEGLVGSLSSGTLLLVVSDHGNIEDVRRGHTLNPTLAILLGPEAPTLRGRLSRITDVPGFILRYLGRGDP